MLPTSSANACKTWHDLKQEGSHLPSRHTKTDEGRLIPLNQTLTSTRKIATRYVRCPGVFISPAKLDRWQPNREQVDARCRVTSIILAFERACQKAGVRNTTFHDLRHTFMTNARDAGIDYLCLMAITGHTTLAVFKRYNTIAWRDSNGAIRQLDIYLGTMDADAQQDGALVIERSDMGR